ncbi:hypothetical protein FGO68_gene6010 [Halteria grandinella]|uniref:Uncharacterized protein n=1 Tax=Halteria grandinella TaxID=5974 RepID=A0A8J8T1U8_HALGN|nr:hypothetical protein FGO68_gene6010 [Halteria grandinella]
MTKTGHSLKNQIRQTNQEKPIKNYVSLLLIGSYTMVYDILVFLNAQDSSTSYGCDVLVPENLTINEVIWFITRSMTNYVWMLPMLYVFWPRILMRQRLRNHTGLDKSTLRSTLTDGADTKGSKKAKPNRLSSTQEDEVIDTNEDDDDHDLDELLNDPQHINGSQQNQRQSSKKGKNRINMSGSEEVHRKYLPVTNAANTKAVFKMMMVPSRNTQDANSKSSRVVSGLGNSQKMGDNDDSVNNSFA